MVLKYKLDRVSLRTGAGTAQGSGEVQQILQDPSGRTQTHKTSISLLQGKTYREMSTHHVSQAWVWERQRQPHSTS